MGGFPKLIKTLLSSKRETEYQKDYRISSLKLGEILLKRALKVP